MFKGSNVALITPFKNNKSIAICINKKGLCGINFTK